MGACSFSTYATGKTVEQAYQNAVEQAQFEYGHDSYNGTISTTSGVVELNVTAGDAETIDNLINKFFDGNMSMPAIQKWGKCGAIKHPDGKGYVFFGWAAE